MLTLNENVLADCVVLETRSAAVVQSELSHYLADHNIEIQGDRKRLHAVVKRTQLQSIALNVIEYGCDVSIAPKSMEDFYLLHINLCGQCEIIHEHGQLTVDSDVAAVCSPEHYYRFQWHPDSRVLAIQIPRERVLSHARSVLGQHVVDNITLDPVIDLRSAKGEALMGLVHYLLFDSTLERGLTKQPTSSILEDALIDTLFRMQPGNYGLALMETTLDRKVLPAHVKKAERYMAANLHRSLRLAELAQMSGVSTRTLSSNFNQFLGSPPAQYFLQMRLEHARSLLLDSRLNKKVGDIARELGFRHHSGFAAAYKARFQETPTETLHRRIGLLVH
ncbi:MAG: AraC family transcriptional regulator [Pseudomonadota bacterium]